MNDQQRLAIWLELVKAAIQSPVFAEGGAEPAAVASFAVETADEVMQTIAERGKVKP